MNKQERDRAVTAIYQLSGGRRDMAEVLADLACSGKVRGRTVEECREAARVCLGEIIGTEIPGQLTADYWGSRQGREAADKIQQWKLDQAEIKKCTMVG